jgi:hypothetical protein
MLPGTVAGECMPELLGCQPIPGYKLNVATTIAGMKPRGSHCLALAVAERVRGARDRLNSTRVPRSRDRAQRGGASPDRYGVRRLLHALPNPSRARQGHAKLATGHTAVSRSHCCHSSSRRFASPLRPHRGVASAPAAIPATAGRTSRPFNTSVLPGISVDVLGLRSIVTRTARTDTLITNFEMECLILKWTFR